MIHITLCGGSGTRLWPISRTSQPKQFIHLFDDKMTLLQKTAVGNQKYTTDCIVVCSQEHFDITQKQLAECSIYPRQFILEPLPRNTAAAVFMAMLAIDKDEIVLITPADHLINYSDDYANALDEAQKYARNNEIAIFGIHPQSPETGYGYIEVVENIVKHFHEKPSIELAKQYVTNPHFYWNSGMICAKAGILLEKIRQYAPDLAKQTELAYNLAIIKNKNVYTIPVKEMEKIPSISIDHALLEKIDSLKCIYCPFSWSDIGCFDALFNQLPQDHAGNAITAKQIISVDSKNNLIIGNHRMIATIDVENIVIVDTPDALLVSKLGSTQKVKEIVQQFQHTDTTIHKTHLEDHRPWGNFTVLASQGTHKVKRIVVLPGKRLSLQKHKFRSEHWIVVAGSALVTVGNEQTLLYKNQSTFIPLGELHRVENPGTEDLVIIEVQYGDYTGEDDIIRVEDDFGRIELAEVNVSYDT